MKRIWIDGSTPASDLRYGFGRTLAIVVDHMPPGESSLDFLLPVIGRIKTLSVFTGRCTDARALSRATKLQELDLSDTRPKYSVDFSGCPLKTLRGRPTAHYESAFRASHLATLYLDEPDESTLRLSATTVRTLYLDKVMDPAATPPDLMFPRLKRIDVRNSPDFDATFLKNSPPPIGADFIRVKEIRGLGAMCDGRELGDMYFQNCPEIHDLSKLINLRPRQAVTVGRKTPFTREFFEGVPDDLKGRWALEWMPN